MLRLRSLGLPFLAWILGVGGAAAQTGIPDNQTLQTGVDAREYVRPAAAVLGATSSELRDLVDRYQTDRATLLRRWHVEHSPLRRERQRQFVAGWCEALAGLDFERLSQQARIDFVLLRTRLEYEQRLLDREETRWNEMQPLLPFGPAIIDLMERRRRMEKVVPAAAAQTLADIATSADSARRMAERREAGSMDAVLAFRSASAARSLQATLGQWYRYYAGYDPLFTWWAEQPFRRADSVLTAYQNVLRTRHAGFRPGQEEPIIGHPIGRQALLEDLASELIPYTPEELIAIGERELAALEGQMLAVSRAMGYGEDWKAALEHVKTLHVAPGEQPELVRALAFEAIDFIESRDLLTIPPLARDDWRIEMLSPEAQRTAPFFLGGDIVQVAFPTNTMTHEDKLMSIRGNNIHFSRAVVHHELIPGHHLQFYMTNRYNVHRRAFSTPFWTEGWALWWEMLLWDQGFPRGPEDQIGMLFWRMHRAARIVFSLKFHLGQWTPQQAIDFLVDRVGHERANATAEVRRSFIGTYSPLYQVAYMMGGLQFRELHRELVQSGRMSNREFHDRILQGGGMPVEMVRAMLLDLPLRPDYQAAWRYLGDPLRR
jgi:uncharacterized protein (DUF885 family)